MGQGWMSSLLAIDIALAFAIVYILWKITAPFIESYHKAANMDLIAKCPNRHWFYGHIRAFGKTSHERLMCSARLTSSFSTLLNIWAGPCQSTMLFFHKDSAVALLNSGAPKDNFAYSFIRPWLGDGLLTSKGKKWQRNRHLLTPAFHFSVLKPYVTVYNNSCRIMLDKWGINCGKPLEITEDVNLMTLDSMLQCAMSAKTECQTVRETHQYIRAIRQIGFCVRKRFLNPFFILDWIYYLSPTGRKFKRAVDEVHAETEKIIKDRKKVLEKTGINDTKRENRKQMLKYRGKNALDFLDILLQTRDEDGKGLSDREIRDEVDTFLFEGHDTTSSGITWSLYNLAKYPALQEKCRSEVLSVVGTKEDVEWEDLAKLTYLTMFIKEDLRLYPPVPMIGRRLENSLPIRSKLHSPQETKIPSGVNTAFSIFMLHRHEQVWENPKEFNPERFTKENCAKRNPYEYLPFSAGPRNCMGQNFAMNEMKVVLAQTLRRFELYLDGETPKPRVDARLVLHSQDGIKIKIRPINETYRANKPSRCFSYTF
ncbi:cytochrome P450 4F2-like isoform X1 [Clavelina lepadiformis]|uniref:cytochrome P450 4F2-like isoform X1 n=2 Tax=Clavelina lepadiformis TaxID=159417 RepID=UPI004041A495